MDDYVAMRLGFITVRLKYLAFMLSFEYPYLYVYVFYAVDIFFGGRNTTGGTQNSTFIAT
jgi:hypothetical protein